MSVAQEYLMDSIQKTIQEHCYNFIERKINEDSGHKSENLTARQTQLRKNMDMDEAIQILTISDKYGFHDVICKAAHYVSAKYDSYFNTQGSFDYSTLIKPLDAEYEFGDKTIVKIIGNMIKKHAKKIRESTKRFKINIDDELTDIERMTKLITTEHFLEDE